MDLTQDRQSRRLERRPRGHSTLHNPSVPGPRHGGDGRGGGGEEERPPSFLSFC